MPEITNTSKLENELDPTDLPEDLRPIMVDVDHVTMEFNMASEKMQNLKEYMIAIAKRRLFFEKFTALDDVSFTVRKGDVFGILGTNGSGKSTVLKIIAGVLEPTSGTCHIGGGIAPLIELGAGFDMELSARENIYLNGALLGYPKEFITEHFDEIVEFAEVEKFLDMPMKNYSSGMTARIAFAISTIMIPEILVVDEVLSVGDFMFQQKCEDRITDLITNHGVTVLIVSHSNDLIERICNKAIWIEKGHTRIMGDASRVCNAYRVLGGRACSEESEKIVYDALVMSEDSDGGGIEHETIGGDDHFEVACELALKQWGDEPGRPVVFVPDFSHNHAVSVAGIAGALGAPILPYKIGEPIPPSVENALLKLKPESIYLFSPEDVIEEAVQASGLSALCDRLIPIDCGLMCVGIRPSILDFGTDQGLWGGDAAIITFFTDHALSVLASYDSYKRHIPVVIFDSFEDELNDKTIAALQRAGISKIYPLGDIAHSALLDELRTLGFTVCAEIPTEENASLLDMTKWLADEDSCDMTDLCIGSGAPARWQELIGVPSYAAARNEGFMLSNPFDLDSYAGDVKYIKQIKPENITFVGDSTFSKVHIDLMTCL